MTTAAIIGYAILAAKDMGWDKRTIEQLERTMKRTMDEKSVHEAEKAYMEN